ncbi:uncharacterized protein LOC115106237 [Oncorhynchus nerka]|uniref:uncharacterized protein LOC115106237 n=1 Tax=Oncorhynchus nerka TaxID=8023 RepID=UPI0031B80618
MKSGHSEAAMKGEDTTVAAENQHSTSGKRKRKVREDASLSEGSTTPEKTKVMYQESGTSAGDSEVVEEDEDEEQTARQPPNLRQSGSRRRMVVAISPMLVSPLKVKIKSPHHSPIVTWKGMHKLNSKKVRLKKASRRLKLQEKV